MGPSLLGQCISELSIGQVLLYRSLDIAGGNQWISASMTMASRGTVAAVPMNGVNSAYSPIPFSVTAWQTDRILVPTTVAAPEPTSQRKSITSSNITIGVGVELATVGFVAIVAIAALLLAWRRNAMLKKRQEESVKAPGSWERKPELTGADQRFEKDPADLKPELSSNRLLNHELPPGSNERVEMDLDGQRFEMDPETQSIELSSDDRPSDMDAAHGSSGASSSCVANQPTPKSSIFLFGKKVAGYWTARR